MKRYTCPVCGKETIRKTCPTCGADATLLCTASCSMCRNQNPCDKHKQAFVNEAVPAQETF